MINELQQQIVEEIWITEISNDTNMYLSKTSATNRIEDKINFKQSKAGLNLEFSFP